MAASKKEYQSPTIQDLGAHVEVVQRFLSQGVYDGRVDFAPLVNS